MSKAARKTRRRNRAAKAPDHSALAEQFRRQVAPLPADWDPRLDIADMYRHALGAGG